MKICFPDNHEEGKMVTNTKDEDIILTEEQLCGWFLHAERLKAIVPLEAVKSIATVKLSCVLRERELIRFIGNKDSRIILTPRRHQHFKTGF